ncbi:MAG: 6-carboxytetrahydropterin synthase [Candidatus Dormibacteraeota bacterium]|nr:6-carboxytetrahydropterin synthase [Candidatus Dormibacteraeota bacterium]
MLKIRPHRAAGPAAPERSAERSPNEAPAEPSNVNLTRRATFAAAHVLRREDWPEEKNREVFGACAGDHGHNYVIEVSVSGSVDPQTGMVINLRSLDAIIRRAIIEHVDHRHLNRDVIFLAGVVPTAENLALAFWAQLDALLTTPGPGGGSRLERLRLIESENNSVEVTR